MQNKHIKLVFYVIFNFISIISMKSITIAIESIHFSCKSNLIQRSMSFSSIFIKITRSTNSIMLIYTIFVLSRIRKRINEMASTDNNNQKVCLESNFSSVLFFASFVRLYQTRFLLLFSFFSLHSLDLYKFDASFEMGRQRLRTILKNYQI